MPRWEDLRFLAALMKTGTLTAAAREAEADPATVSRRIRRLSETLGIELMIKSPSGWSVNPAARPLAEEAMNFGNRLEQAIHVMQTRDGKISGEISVAAPPMICSHVLHPAIGGLVSRHPALNLTMKHQVLSAALGEHDLIVTPQQPERGRLVVRPLGHMIFSIYGRDPDASTGRWVGLVRDYDEQGAGAWSLTQFPMRPAYRLENFNEILNVMQQTRLPGILPGFVAEEDETLLPVFPDREPMRMNLYLCYHETRRLDPLVGAVSDWLAAAFKARTDGRTLLSSLA